MASSISGYAWYPNFTYNSIGVECLEEGEQCLPILDLCCPYICSGARQILCTLPIVISLCMHPDLAYL